MKKCSQNRFFVLLTIFVLIFSAQFTNGLAWAEDVDTSSSTPEVVEQINSDVEQPTEAVDTGINTSPENSASPESGGSGDLTEDVASANEGSNDSATSTDSTSTDATSNEAPQEELINDETASSTDSTPSLTAEELLQIADEIRVTHDDRINPTVTLPGFDISSTTTTTDPTSEDIAPNDENASSTNLLDENASLEDTSTTSTSTNATTTIDTGNAEVVADLLNTANLNLNNSEGTISIIDSLDPDNDDLIIPGFNTTSSTDCGTDCELNATGTSGITVMENTNSAGVDNTVNLAATSGSNMENLSGGGAGVINTGSAIAEANVVNLVNTNITDSKYSITIGNKMGDWGGDVVLPAKAFFESLLANAAASSPFSWILNNNTALLENNSVVNADTGENDINGAGGKINTGNAVAVANNYNLANANIINTNYVFIFIKVVGNWLGEILGLPSGLFAERTADGILISNVDVNSLAPEPESRNGIITDREARRANRTYLENNNTALITNNVNVHADTGNNTIEGGNSNSSINTGDAYALSNIVNLANLNIVGSNVMTAFVNILGNWTGNVVFGRPDLKLSGQVIKDKDILTPDSAITLKLNLTNNGDSDASNVVIASNFDKPELITITDPGSGQITPSGIKWNASALNIGESLSLEFKAVINGNIPSGNNTLTINSSAQSTGKDGNDSDNSNVIALSVLGIINSGGDNGGGGSSGGNNEGSNNNGGGSGGGSFPLISMVKTSDANNATPGSTVHYSVVVKDDSYEGVYNAVVIDELKDPSGKIVNRNVWDVGQINPSEEILLSYDVTFVPSAPLGNYVNYAWLTAKNYSGFSIPVVGVSHTITLSAFSAQGDDSGFLVAGANSALDIIGYGYGFDNQLASISDRLPVVALADRENKGIKIADELKVENPIQLTALNVPNDEDENKQGSLLASAYETIGKNILLFLIILACALIITVWVIAKKERE